jgi:hypothetical protein
MESNWEIQKAILEHNFRTVKRWIKSDPDSVNPHVKRVVERRIEEKRKKIFL